MIRLLLAVLLIGLLGHVAIAAARPMGELPDPVLLEPAPAIGIRIDTLLIGGFSAGTFTEAMDQLASELNREERILVGQHLEQIFAEVLPGRTLGRAGRLRVAYERTRRPDGSTRSIRVLGAEAAVAGRVHTAYYFERESRPGYFDAFGRALHATDRGGPLPDLRVTSAFGDRRPHPILGRILPHTGVDLAARSGDPVRATGDGIVAIASHQGGYGLLIELRHPDGYSTRYAHLSALAPGIEPARLVRRGEVIGFVGMSGLATGPHLHFEVRRRGQAVDPMRTAGEIASDAGIADDPRWTAERRLLGAVLARVPTVTITSTTPSHSTP